jgi:dCTP deaminase
MILSDASILREIEAGAIVIRPFDRKRLGCNSYDVTLGRTLGTYQGAGPMDVKRELPLDLFEIPDDGYTLLPAKLYLGTTNEYTEAHQHVPFLEGKSSLGRLGIQVHLTAGVGDIGFRGHWTLEILCVRAVRIYANMSIGQLVFHTVEGEVLTPYDRKPSAKYANEAAVPVASAMWKNFVTDDR